jgi:hypothetical protein
MEALSHADCATVENIDGIYSGNSEGNEVKWGDDDGCSFAVKDPHQSCPPTKVRLLGFIDKLSTHCPCVLCGPHLFVLRRALET